MIKTRKREPEAGEDWGTGTRAAMRGTVLERVPGDANRRKRRVRRLPWEDARSLGARLSDRQQRAAARLHEVHVATQTSPERLGVYVDRTPDPSAAAVLATHRLFARAEVWRHVPSAQAGVVMHVCGEGRALRDGYSRNGLEAGIDLAQLMVALDCVANGIGL